LKYSTHGRYFYTIDSDKRNIWAQNINLAFRLWWALFPDPGEARRETTNSLIFDDLEVFLDKVTLNAKAWLLCHATGETFKYQEVEIPFFDKANIDDLDDTRLFLTRGLFLKKLQLPNQETLYGQAVASYLDVERLNRKKSAELKRDLLFGGTDEVLTAEQRWVMTAAKNLITFVFREEPDWSSPKHGPGKTAERCEPDVISKEKYMLPLLRENPELFDGFTLSGYIKRILQFPQEFGEAELLSQLDALSTYQSRELLRQSSEELLLTAVPDAYNKVRVITMEPTYKMFWQQDVLAKIVFLLMKDPVLSKIVNITDQEPQRQMIRFFWSIVTTTDLSRSSDRVLFFLIEWLFSDTFFGGVLDRLRTEKVFIDGKTVSLEKFSGMGNALTFPFQSLLFSTLAWAINPTAKITVFGDDIITEDNPDSGPPVTEELHRLLEALGLKINVTKTFRAQSEFKETCGLFLLKGREVTPLYYSRKPETYLDRWDTKEEMRLLDLHNRAVEAGFDSLAQEIRVILDEHECVPTKAATLAYNDRLLTSKEEAFLDLELRFHETKQKSKTMQRTPDEDPSFERYEYASRAYVNKVMPVGNDGEPEWVKTLHRYRATFTAPDPINPGESWAGTRLEGILSSANVDWKPKDLSLDLDVEQVVLAPAIPEYNLFMGKLSEFDYPRLGLKDSTLPQAIRAYLRDENRSNAIRLKSQEKPEKKLEEDDIVGIPSKTRTWRSISDRCPVPMDMVLRYVSNQPADASELSLFKQKGPFIRKSVPGTKGKSDKS
jgi:hypothetical protein